MSTNPTPEQMRIAIAECCGWERTDPTPFTYITMECVVCPVDTESTWLNPRGEQAIAEWIPNYPEDLNACHEMEKVIPTDRQIDYLDALAETCQKRGPEWRVRYLHTTSTSLQRCLAFLRVMRPEMFSS